MSFSGAKPSRRTAEQLYHDGVEALIVDMIG
jgi:hypothetical protein